MESLGLTICGLYEVALFLLLYQSYLMMADIQGVVEVGSQEKPDNMVGEDAINELEQLMLGIRRKLMVSATGKGEEAMLKVMQDAKDDMALIKELLALRANGLHDGIDEKDEPPGDNVVSIFKNGK